MFGKTSTSSDCPFPRSPKEYRGRGGDKRRCRKAVRPRRLARSPTGRLSAFPTPPFGCNASHRSIRQHSYSNPKLRKDGTLVFALHAGFGPRSRKNMVREGSSAMRRNILDRLLQQSPLLKTTDIPTWTDLEAGGRWTDSIGGLQPQNLPCAFVRLVDACQVCLQSIRPTGISRKKNDD